MKIRHLYAQNRGSRTKEKPQFVVHIMPSIRPENVNRERNAPVKRIQSGSRRPHQSLLQPTNQNSFL